MQPVILLILFITFCRSSALSCLKSTDGKAMEFDLNSVHSHEIHETIQALTFDDFDNTQSCRIELYIEYEENILSIKFTNHMQVSLLKDERVRIDLLVTGDELDEIFIGYFLEYACSDNQCDLNFILNYTNWFIDGEKPDLVDELEPHILGDGHVGSGYCVNNDLMGEECSTDHCVIRMDHGEMMPRLSHYCARTGDVKSAGFYVTWVFNMGFSENLWNYEFRCDYDDCNVESTLEEMITILHSKYDIESIFKIFGFTNIPNEENITTIVSMESSDVTDTIQSSTTSKSVPLTTSTSTTSESVTLTTSTTTDSPSTKSSTSTRSSTATISMPNLSGNTTTNNMNITTSIPSHARYSQVSNTVIVIASMIMASLLLLPS